MFIKSKKLIISKKKNLNKLNIKDNQEIIKHINENIQKCLTIIYKIKFVLREHCMGIKKRINKSR